MKKTFISILFIVTFSLVIGLSSPSNPALANPLIEEVDDLIVLEGDLANVDVQALVAEVIAEDSLYDVTEIEALIEETIASSRAVFILNQPLHLSLFLDGLIANNGDTILLGSNINMTGFGPFTGRSYFDGTFNGNSFTISNLRLESPSGQPIGFINESSQISFLNVTFENLQVVRGSGGITGGVVGLLDGSSSFGSSLIDSVSITGDSFVRQGFSVGGFVGEARRANLSIRNSENHGSVSGHASIPNVGGFVGVAHGNYTGPSVITNMIEILNSTNYGPVTSGGSTGGLIGLTRDNEFNRLNVVIENSSNYGHISGVRTGGIVGESVNHFSQISITNVYNNGNASSGGPGAGGIFGRIQSDLTSNALFTLIDVRNSGNISGPFASGIIGFMTNAHVEIQDAINTGDIGDPTAWEVGGIIGALTASYVEIQNATNSGMIHARTAGGILGAIWSNSDVIVTNWSNSGLVIGTVNAGQCVAFVEPGSTVICS